MDVAVAQTILKAANSRSGRSGATQQIISLRKRKGARRKPKPSTNEDS